MKINLSLLLPILIFTACNRNHRDTAEEQKHKEDSVMATPAEPLLIPDSLPAPGKSTIQFSDVVGWKDGRTPVAPAGFTVTKYADGFENPRWIYITPNGDVLVAESNGASSTVKKIENKIIGRSKSMNTNKSADRITILADKNNDGVPEIRQTFLSGLHQPFGMLVIGNLFYVANTDALYEFPYQPGQTEIKAEGKKIVSLPKGGYNNHWTRNIITNAKKDKIYISVGSGSNAAEHGMENEVRRANILEVTMDGTGEKIYASGLRNPVGMGWAPGTNDLWAAVNERDELGDELVPDYATHVKEGAFYGWPYSYYGQYPDPRIKEKDQRPDLVQRAIKPDVSLGAHTASLGLAFYTEKEFPAHYHNGMFIAQHGSWNKSSLAGYKVVFVPFHHGKPSGLVEDFLTGFIANEEKSEVYGRPVGIAVLPDGSMLVADDAGNTIWKIQVESRK